MFFNVTTFAATRADLTLAQERHLVWAPDAFGSVAFLVASWFAYSEVNRGVLPRSDRSTGWRISALNMLGSIAFGASAIGARYLRSTGELANLALVNLGTFVGAVCFLLGAILLPVESARDRVSHEAARRDGVERHRATVGTPRLGAPGSRFPGLEVNDC